MRLLFITLCSQLTLVSGVPGVHPWMSFGGSPPLLLSAWLLVMETSLKPAGPVPVSATLTVTVIGRSVWFGGQSRFGLAVQLTVGGVASGIGCQAGKRSPGKSPG